MSTTSPIGDQWWTGVRTTPVPIPQGWQCPSCGSVYAPTWFQCMKCVKPTITYVQED